MIATVVLPQVAYDGNDVMPYDSKLDVWSLLVHREEFDDG